METNNKQAESRPSSAQLELAKELCNYVEADYDKRCTFSVIGEDEENITHVVVWGSDKNIIRAIVQASKCGSFKRLLLAVAPTLRAIDRARELEKDITGTKIARFAIRYLLPVLLILWSLGATASLSQPLWCIFLNGASFLSSVFFLIDSFAQARDDRRAREVYRIYRQSFLLTNEDQD